MACRVLEEGERARALVRRVRLDLGADQELAAIRLRDVDVHLRRDDDDVEERLHRFGDERLEDVRRDRQPDLGEIADEGRPAGRRAHHRVAGDVAAVRAHPGDAYVSTLDSGHLGVRVDLDAAAVGAAREAPDDRVVADDPARRVIQGAEDGPGRMVREVELRAEVCDLVVVDEPAVDPEQLVDLGSLGHRHHRPLGVREREVPRLREEQVEVEVCAEPLVELDAALVEGCTLGRAVVRADDRRVPTGGTGADVALLEHRHALDAVILDEVVRRRETVRTGTDDHDIVPVLELGTRAPHATHPEDVLHARPAWRSRTASTTQWPYSCGKKIRKLPSVADTSAGTPATLPAAGRAVRSRSVRRRIRSALSSAIPASAPVRSMTRPGRLRRSSAHSSGEQTTSARAGVILSTSRSESSPPTDWPRTSSLPWSERSRMPCAPSSARASGETARGAKPASARDSPGERKASSLMSAAALLPGRRTGAAARARARGG